MTDRVMVLCIASKHFDFVSLRIDEEFREIENKVQRSPYRDLVELIPRSVDTNSQLATQLLRHRPHILHISAHGYPAEVIPLADSNGETILVSAREFATFIKSFKDNIRIVFFNVCSSKACAEAVAEEIDFVIGLDGSIEDVAAIDLSSAFYQALAFGRPVKEAFENG